MASASRLWGCQGPGPGTIRRWSQALGTSRKPQTATVWDFFFFFGRSVLPLPRGSLWACPSWRSPALCLPVSLSASASLSGSASLSLCPFLSLMGPQHAAVGSDRWPIRQLACVYGAGHLGPGVGRRWLEPFTCVQKASYPHLSEFSPSSLCPPPTTTPLSFLSTFPSRPVRPS